MRLLLLGDSLFARKEGKPLPHIEYSLLKRMPGVEIVNWAVSGDNSFDLLNHVMQHPIPTSDWVFLFIGANDLAQHKQVFLGEYAENLSQIVQRISRVIPSQRICLLTPSPVDETKQVYRTNRLVGYYGEMVKKVAKQYGTRVIDTKVVFSQQEVSFVELLRGSMDDGLHFGEVGYERIAEALLDTIRKEKSSSN